MARGAEKAFDADDYLAKGFEAPEVKKAELKEKPPNPFEALKVNKEAAEAWSSESWKELRGKTNGTGKALLKGFKDAAFYGVGTVITAPTFLEWGGKTIGRAVEKDVMKTGKEAKGAGRWVGEKVAGDVRGTGKDIKSAATFIREKAGAAWGWLKEQFGVIKKGAKETGKIGRAEAEKLGNLAVLGWRFGVEGLRNTKERAVNGVRGVVESAKARAEARREREKEAGLEAELEQINSVLESVPALERRKTSIEAAIFEMRGQLDFLK